MSIDELGRRLQASAAAGEAMLQLVDDPAAGGPGPDTQRPDGTFVPCFGSLEQWVVSVFAPTFVRRSTPQFRWCAQWWRHPEAISRLEALWRTWETLRLDPLVGIATWYRDHLDPQLAVLTSAAGPFADCDPTRHFPPETDRLAHTPAPDDWWPAATT